MTAGSPYESDPAALLGLAQDDDPAEAEALDELFLRGTPGEVDPPPQDPTESPAFLIDQMVEVGEHYMKVERDPADKATMAQVLAKLRAYQAREHKQSELATKYIGKRL